MPLRLNCASPKPLANAFAALIPPVILVSSLSDSVSNFSKSNQKEVCF
ncbi:hypothetical protein N42_0789 [Lactococcus lactis subsp. lactis]|uniref:Uncharacterized protein n=1 Tax=Lactococcus lactis subsp. lactis TaxID=1360 RepID=A0A0V8EQK3_LACLL|nr:hypothetical protein N42_0789 [Lactococcus lactis subsp. lactis]